MHGRLSQVQRVLSALEHLEALTSIATERGPSSERSAALSFLLLQGGTAVSRNLPATTTTTTSKPSQTSRLGPPCQEGMPEALAWVAWASNDIERRTLDFIVICIASLHIARFRAGVASFEVRQMNLRERVLDTFLASIRDWLPMPVALIRPTRPNLALFEKAKVSPPPKRTSLSG
jgi:hypothetical protein